MQNSELVNLLLEAHEVSVVVTGPWGEETHLTVAVPDLRSAPRSVWGDWGPMYTISMPPGQTIDVSVRTPANPAVSRESLDLNQLEIESPMLAATREVTPLMIKLPLPKQSLSLRIFYDTRGRSVRAELVPMTHAAGRQDIYDVAIANGQKSSSARLYWNRAGRTDHVVEGARDASK